MRVLIDWLIDWLSVLSRVIWPGAPWYSTATVRNQLYPLLQTVANEWFIITVYHASRPTYNTVLKGDDGMEVNGKYQILGSRNPLIPWGIHLKFDITWVIMSVVWIGILKIWKKSARRAAPAL